MEKIVNLENETLEKEISGNEIQQDPATEPVPAEAENEAAEEVSAVSAEADGEAAEEAPAAPAEAESEAAEEAPAATSETENEAVEEVSAASAEAENEAAEEVSAASAEADGDVAEEVSAALAERYRIFLTTHKGLVRDDNEDNFTINTASRKLAFKNINYVSEAEAPLLAAVFDGMGGESKGDYASYISAKTAKRLYTSLKEGDGAPVAEQIAQYVQNANDQIRDFLEENNCRSGGSTVCAVIIRDGVVYPFSLGDSRIYLLDPDGMVQLSKDQTLAMKKYEANIYTLEEAENSVDSHKLTAFLGVDYYREGLAPQLYDTFAWQPQDRILLCSDGLYGELTNDVIQSIIREYPDNPTLELVRAALKNGGRDNVTCVLIERVE